MKHCVEGESLLLTGKTHLAKKIVEAFKSTETRCRMWVWWLRHGKLRNRHCSATWLVIKELTQLETTGAVALRQARGPAALPEAV